MPTPYVASRPGSPLSVAVLNRRLTTLAAFRFGYFERINASTPDTIAVELLVPLPMPYPDLTIDFGSALTTPLAGAAIELRGSLIVPDQAFPSCSVPLTPITPGTLAGAAISMSPSGRLPLAATMMTSLDRA